MNRIEAQFGLRTLFIAMTLSACAFAILAWWIQLPILRLMLYCYVPLYAIYFLIRGPFIYRRWRRLRRDYQSVTAEREAIVKAARARHPDGDNQSPADGRTNGA